MNAASGADASIRDGIADYRFLKMLGDGNYGVYYLARRPERLPIDDELVAVKVLSGVQEADGFRRAIRELTAFAAVKSPYLVNLYEAGQQGDEMYYSMEYLPRGSLDTSERLPRRDVLVALANAARAAHSLHEAGLAHNDIKPGNVLLVEGGGRLTDLGLSHLLASGLTAGTGLGPRASIEYVDPSLIRGGSPSRATDIFALGATLHRALSGEGLYGHLPADNVLASVRKMLAGPPVISAALEPGARPLIEAALSEDLSARPVTATALADGIEAILSSEDP